VPCVVGNPKWIPSFMEPFSKYEKNVLKMKNLYLENVVFYQHAKP
jgi:hypothetical protein